ncbi:response regulator [Egbenema bharatensis]|uniref:response regulator n=1 Tax=Egbenema bharatensis TaxID=3463334 RepID=UPI003A87BF4D
MTAYEIRTLDELEMNIRVCGQKQFTGRLELKIQDFAGLQWNFFFYGGGLIEGSSSVHPVRRWCRQVAQYCPQLAIESSQPSGHRQAHAEYSSQYIDQTMLRRLTQQGKVSQEQMTSVVAGNLREILFDLIQLGKQHRNRLKAQLIYGQLPPAMAATAAGVIPVEQIWHQALESWKDWHQAGLGSWSPNWSPVIWDAQELQQQTSLLVYHNLTTWINGDRTLRDLAVKLKQPLVALTQSLLPYIRKGIIGLIEVRDWQRDPGSKLGFLFDQVTPISQVRSTSPLVAYIEDSRFDCIAMNQILAQAGCRFISIQDPLQALPILMEQKPDAIFLDLLMPVTNGYEVCAQIRRISAFQNTPIIIVTSSDGIVDRVRAKLVGSSGFISKPIEPDKIIPVLRDYLPSSSQQN